MRRNGFSLDPRLWREARAALVVLLALLATYLVLKGGSLSAVEVRNLVASGLPLVFVALGQYIVVMTRGIDLSLGPVASLATCIVALHDVLPAAPLLAVLAGAAAGALNGGIVNRFAAPSVIVTLGTMTILQGVALMLLPAPGGSIVPSLAEFFTWGRGVVSGPTVVLAIVVLAGALFAQTRGALEARAVGTDAALAAVNGIPVGRTRFAAFVLAGILASLGGIALAAATASGSPVIGDTYTLASIAAVVVGGAALRGGYGSPLGIVLGCYSLNLTGSILFYAQVSSFYQSVVEGIVLLVAVAFATINWRRNAPAAS